MHGSGRPPLPDPGDRAGVWPWSAAQSLESAADWRPGGGRRRPLRLARPESADAAAYRETQDRIQAALLAFDAARNAGPEAVAGVRRERQRRGSRHHRVGGVRGAGRAGWLPRPHRARSRRRRRRSTGWGSTGSPVATSRFRRPSTPLRTARPSAGWRGDLHGEHRLRRQDTDHRGRLQRHVLRPGPGSTSRVDAAAAGSTVDVTGGSVVSLRNLRITLGSIVRRWA